MLWRKILSCRDNQLLKHKWYKCQEILLYSFSTNNDTRGNYESTHLDKFQKDKCFDKLYSSISNMSHLHIQCKSLLQTRYIMYIQESIIGKHYLNRDSKDLCNCYSKNCLTTFYLDQNIRGN